MQSEPTSPTAVVTFATARQAERRVAGVAVAARIVREAAAAGLAEIWLILPPGSALGAVATADVRRLGGRAIVHVTDEPPAWLDAAGDRTVLRLPGDRLVPAEAISALAAGEPAADVPGGIDLAGRAASAELLRRTGKPGDGPVSRWLNRPVSRRISAILLHLPGFRPIHATIGTAALAATMFGLLVVGGSAGLMAGALLFQAASIFDGVDGEIARATFRTSRAGAVIDSAVDVATNVALILGVTINLGLAGQQLAWLLGGWGLALFGLGLVSIAWRASRSPGAFSLDLIKHHYRHRFSQRIVPLLIRIATIVSSRDFYALLFMLLILVGLPMAVLDLFAAAATVWIMFVLGSIRRAGARAVA